MRRKQRNDNSNGNKHSNSQITLKQKHKAYNGNRHNADFKVLCHIRHSESTEKRRHHLPECRRKHGIRRSYAWQKRSKGNNAYCNNKGCNY